MSPSPDLIGRPIARPYGESLYSSPPLTLLVRNPSPHFPREEELTSSPALALHNPFTAALFSSVISSIVSPFTAALRAFGNQNFLPSMKGCTIFSSPQCYCSPVFLLGM